MQSGQPSSGRSQGDGGNAGKSGAQGSAQASQSGGALSRSPGRRELSPLSGNPFEMMQQLSRDMDRMMSAFTGGSPFFGSSMRSLLPRNWQDEWAAPTMWMPRIDIEQRGDAIRVRADLPGVRKEDVQIDVTEDGLTLSGERREEREEGGEKQGYRAIERSYGSFYRTVPLPQGANLEQLKAKMKNGVLEITVPLSESAKARRIQIED
jgi:HSP20 family protein